jgi:peptide/nickel transport system permease protein
MGRYIIRRVAQGLVVIFLLTSVLFVVTRLIGDPVNVMLPIEASPEARAEFSHALGLDRPIPAQFATYLSDLIRLDFGESLWQRRPALDVIKERFPYTAQLVILSMVLALILAIPMGILSAMRPGSWRDQGITTVSLLGLSAPDFWVGLILIVIFGVQLRWLPVAGAGTPIHLILPVFTLALPIIARLTMVVRSSMIDELNESYVQTARAKNLSTGRIVGVHALRNASVPVVALASFETVRMLAGYTILVETVFAWPGLGYTLSEAIMRQDLILINAIVFFDALLVVILNIGTDILHRFIDPRVQMA